MVQASAAMTAADVNCPNCGSRLCEEQRAVANGLRGTPNPAYQPPPGTEPAQAQRYARMLCRRCNHRFGVVVIERGSAAASAPPPAAEGAAIPYRSDLARCWCPQCNAPNPPVVRTMREGETTVRYHKCKCGHPFKSAETA
jgi:DNA-directed RNA polymerase subunit RPC12/RpoP